MGKKNHPQQRSNQNSSAPQHHLTRESGRIRQRDEERQGQNQNQHHHHRFNQIQQQQQQQQQQLTPEERYAKNVNLLVLNLNSNPEQIYRETIGKMLHSMTTPYHQKFHVPPKTAEEEEKQEGDADEKKDGNDKKQQNKNNKKNKNKQQQQQTSNDHNNNSHILSAEKASFFPEDQQTATMLIHFPDKFSAKKLAQKLNQGQLFSSSASSSGEQNNNSNVASATSGTLHASVVPTVTLKPRYEPCALRITELLSPAQMNYDSTSSFTLSQLQQYLSSNPGFLSVSKVARVEAEKEEEQQQQQQENSNNKKKKNQQQQQDKNNNSSSNNNSKRCFIATYADSGAALQARALMSGRAFHGVHLLLELIEEVENERVVPLV